VEWESEEREREKVGNEREWGKFSSQADESPQHAGEEISVEE
jgi:hypothetical protein